MLKIERLFRVLLILAIVASIASCSRSSDNSSSYFEEILPDDSTPETLRDTQISFAIQAIDMTTKAGYSSESVPNEFELNIISSESQYSYSDVEMVRADTSSPWVSDVTMYWADDTTPIEIEAFVPYRYNESSYTITSDQSSAELLESCDLLYYYNASVLPTSEDVPINFEHIMSKVYFKINLVNSGSYADLSTNPISDVEITGVLTTADISTPYDIKAEKTTTGDTITPYTLSSGTTELGEAYYTSTTDSATSYYEAIFVPQTIAAGDLAMSLLVGNKEANWLSSESYTFDGGQIYVITLNLTLSMGSDSSAGALQYSSYSCSDWFRGETIIVAAKPIE